MKRFFSLAMLLMFSFRAAAQGTVFTYQGRLNDNNAPANGRYDFRLRLASDPQGNVLVAGPLLTNSVPVSGGLFTFTVDFGPGVFTGSNYWLQPGCENQQCRQLHDSNAVANHHARAVRRLRRCCRKSHGHAPRHAVDRGAVLHAAFGDVFRFGDPEQRRQYV